jgi:hypothetical protein
MPAGLDVRDCRLYRFWVEHPVTGEEVLGYVGETVRQPFARLMEHVDSQPWMDTVTRWERDPVVYPGKLAVLEAEAAAIRIERPLYNVKGNLDNPERVPPPLAIRQRRARDAEHGKPRWVHPDDRGLSVSTPVRPVRLVSVPRRWTAVRVKACLWSGVWVMTAVAISGALRQHGLFDNWLDRTLFGLAVAPVLLVWSLAGAPITARQWHKVKARIRRRGWKSWMRW